MLGGLLGGNDSLRTARAVGVADLGGSLTGMPGISKPEGASANISGCGGSIGARHHCDCMGEEIVECCRKELKYGFDA